MKRVVAIVALGAVLVLGGLGCGGSTSALSHHKILLLGTDHDAARIFVWSPGSPAKPIIGPQPWGGRGLCDCYSVISDAYWSPAGNSVAFEEDFVDSLYPPTPQIELIPSVGARPELISGNMDQDPVDFPAVPSWSPDGHQLVYARQHWTKPESTAPQLFVIIDLGAGHERSWRVDSATSEPVWGKPGIAYFSHSGIMLLNPVTGRSRLVTSRFRSGTLAWSPRGVLAVGVRRQIVILTAAGRVLRKLSLPHTAKWVCAIAWDPTGERILVGTRKSWDEMAGLWVGTLSTKELQIISPVPTWRNYRYDCGVSWR